MEYKTTRVTNPNDGYRTRTVREAKTYSNRGGIGEGLAYVAGCGISSAAEKTGDVGFYILIICDGEFCDDLFLYFKKYIDNL